MEIKRKIEVIKTFGNECEREIKLRKYYFILDYVKELCYSIYS